jgi:hypothetical protein
MKQLLWLLDHLLRYEDQDERIEVENAAVLALAKKRQLMS